MNFEQLLKLTVSVIADMTFISVLNDHTFYNHFVLAIIFKKNLHMNVAMIDFFSLQYIHFLFSTKRVNSLLPKLARNASIEYRVGRVLNFLKYQVLSTRSFNFKKTSNYSTHNLE